MSRRTQDSKQSFPEILITGLSPSLAGLPSTVLLSPSLSTSLTSYNPKIAVTILVWASPLSLAATKGISF